jgi:hypothetical protein
MANRLALVIAGAALLLLHMLALGSTAVAPGERFVLMFATGSVAFGVFEFAVLAYAAIRSRSNSFARDQDWDVVSRMGHLAIALGALGDVVIAASVLTGSGG